MSLPTPPPSPDSSGPPADARDRLRQLFEAHRREIQALLDRLKAHLPELTALPDKVSSHWHGEDGFYQRRNQRWLEETRPILEAFFHARTRLGLAVRYGRELTEPPQPMPSGWAAVLYLFNLR